MKFTSPVISAASGSIAGITYSRNRGGNYQRARAVPTNPNTVRQQTLREAVGSLSNTWNNGLTDLQRDAWNLYAANTPVIDPLGQSIKLSGFNMFVRTNSLQLQGGLGLLLGAPSVFNLGATPAITGFTVDIGADPGGLAVQGTVEGATDTDAVVLFLGRPTNPGVSFFRGPYRFWGAFPTDSDGAFSQTSNTPEYPFPIAEGNKVYVRARAILIDGRCSANAQATTIVANTP
jgi:hypothetical protein